jgi:hypothetical protein
MNKKKILALPLSVRALLVPRDPLKAPRFAGDLRAQKYKSCLHFFIHLRKVSIFYFHQAPLVAGDLRAQKYKS